MNAQQNIFHGVLHHTCMEEAVELMTLADQLSRPVASVLYPVYIGSKALEPMPKYDSNTPHRGEFWIYIGT